jgi:hypothetical protein
MAPAQRFGNWLAPALLNLLYGHAYADLGPLRLVRRSAYEAMAMRDRGFGWTVEMQARACELGLRIADVPVRCLPRQGGRSKISGTLAGSARAGAVILTTLGGFAARRWRRPLVVASAALLLGGALLMAPQGNFHNPEAPPLFLLAAGVMSLGFVLSWGVRSVAAPVAFGVALAARLALLPMEPGTDVWRYLWEGIVQNAGFNPYVLAPDAPALAALRTDWWPRINHAAIPAIYPPLAELVFRGLAAISPTLLFFKLAIVAADLGVCALLWRRFQTASLIYAWNPLVLYVFAGGAHYDSLFLLPLVAGWLAFESPAPRGALLIGVSVAMKYVSAPIAAFVVLTVWRRRGLRAALAAGLLAAAPFVLALLVFWGAFGVHPIASAEFGQYARSAELVPRVAAYFWEETRRNNAIFLWPFAAVAAWRLWRSRSLGAFAEDTFLALYVLSPAVHPWYFTWAIPFAAASGNLGFRLIGVSAFTYFCLEYRQAVRVAEWRQSWIEAALMWSPLVLGFAWSRWRARAPTRPDRPRPREPVRALAR